MLPDINLLPDYERQSSLLYVLFWIGLVICFILFGVLGYFYFTEKSSLEDMEKQLQQVNDEKMILEEKLASSNSEDETGTLENAVLYAENHLIPTSKFIDELLTLLPENGYLSNYYYNYQSVDIETQLETMSDAAAYVVALEQSDYVKDIKVNNMDIFELGNEENSVEGEEVFDMIPRYNVSYSINVDQLYMKEEGEGDE